MEPGRDYELLTGDDFKIAKGTYVAIGRGPKDIVDGYRGNGFRHASALKLTDAADYIPRHAAGLAYSPDGSKMYLFSPSDNAEVYVVSQGTWNDWETPKFKKVPKTQDGISLLPTDSFMILPKGAKTLKPAIFFRNTESSDLYRYEIAQLPTVKNGTKLNDAFSAKPGN